ncbi:MAG: T9SS type A sorting domain-containing protein [Candidatus Aegiribacteria sp.]|nr:T9SS type A sorting domain-containing protein [Candidatus Aegiribacteria sp.]
MTGLGWNGTKLYASTTYSSYNGCYTFNFYSTYFSNKADYIFDFWGPEKGYDIAYLNGDIWMAVDNSTSPIRCYEKASGGVLDAIPASIGIGSDVHGVTCETGTDAPYLWVSNQTTDELYRINLFTGIADDDKPLLSNLRLSCSTNPFYSSVVITGNDFFGASILEIYDVTGRILESVSFSGTYTWNATGIPDGAYFVNVSDCEGNREFLKLLKL